MKILSLAKATEFYLQHRRQLGFALREDGWMLRGLAAFAAQRKHRGALTVELALAWAQAPAQSSSLWWARRLETVRRFAIFWKAFDPRTQVPPAGVFGPAYRRRPVHIYTQQEINALMKAAGNLDGLRGATFQTLLGLLAFTGLRIGEALRLEERDIDWTRSLLTIRHSKSGRSRCLPLHDSTLACLRVYQQKRRRYPARKDAARFFRGADGRALSYVVAALTFRSLCRQLGWIGCPVPRLHDLRHTFAVDCLILWHRQQQDIHQKVLALATYLGHSNIANTYWYFSAVPQLMALVQNRWQAFEARHGGAND